MFFATWIYIASDYFCSYKLKRIHLLAEEVHTKCLGLLWFAPANTPYMEPRLELVSTPDLVYNSAWSFSTTCLTFEQAKCEVKRYGV